ncbi:MAG TPA: hypothetical protein VMF03_06250 [Steroidobacteraceae bacterium]|nr:hypothetical protein [Steroidobacteraceae bacterium]
MRLKAVIGALVIGACLPLLAHADNMAMSKADESKMSCQEMMDHAKPMMDKMTDGSSMKMKAQKEMDSAKMAMDKGEMKTCKSRMHKAMGMMKQE